MRNPFILLRFVLFSFLLYLNILALAFAAWNVAAQRDAQLDVQGAPIFIIFNACCLIIYAAMVITEATFSTIWTLKVMTECVWMAAFSILQLAAAIDVTINASTIMCHLQFNANVCASSSVLIAITWISSSLSCLYLLLVIGITATHSSAHPAIWGTAMSSMPWFDSVNPSTSRQKALPNLRDVEREPYENPVFFDDEALSVTSSTLAVEMVQSQEGKPSSFIKGFSISSPQSKSVESFRPSWAKVVNARRGVDPPFVVSGKPRAVAERFKSCWSASTTFSAPPVPPKAHTTLPRGTARQAYDEYVVSVGSDFSLPMIAPSPSRPISYGIFPDDVEDPDVPIEAQHRSQWINASKALSSDTYSSSRFAL